MKVYFRDRTEKPVKCILNFSVKADLGGWQFDREYPQMSSLVHWNTL